MDKYIADPSPSLEDVSQQFEHWRATRKSRREPIPQHLWTAAAELCQNHTISQVCKTLRLSHSCLKSRLIKESPPKQDFLEIDLNPTISNWEINCVRTDKSTLNISGQGQHPNIAEILGVFLS